MHDIRRLAPISSADLCRIVGAEIWLNNYTLCQNGDKRVLIIGLDQLGLPVAKYVKEKGFDVYGYDISQKT